MEWPGVRRAEQQSPSTQVSSWRRFDSVQIVQIVRSVGGLDAMDAVELSRALSRIELRAELTRAGVPMTVGSAGPCGGILGVANQAVPRRLGNHLCSAVDLKDPHELCDSVLDGVGAEVNSAADLRVGAARGQQPDDFEVLTVEAHTLGCREGQAPLDVRSARSVPAGPEGASR